MIIWQVILLIFLLLLSAVFSGAEVALLSLGPIKLRSMIRKRIKGAKSVKELKKESQKMIITILIGNNLVNVASSVLATIISTDLFGSKGVGIAIGAMTFLVLIFGEITPKSYASSHPDKVALWVAKPLLILQEILLPLVNFFEWLSAVALRLFGKPPKKKKILTEDDLKIAIDIGAEEKSIEQNEKQLLKNVLEFNDITANEVMIPRQKMFCLDANLKVSEAMETVADSPYSRIPLYMGSLNNIVGIIHTKDVLEALTDNEAYLPLKDIAVKPFFIHEKTVIDDLFKMFQERHCHIAIVIGDNGKTVGLITIEDLLEELVGEIIDESDVNPNRIMRINKQTILVDGETTSKYLNSFFNMSIDEKYETVSDFLIRKFRGMPGRGQMLKIKKHSFFIEEVGEEHIERVKVKRL
ncbi:MAG: hemolysin family protein [Nanoarchaeota archaeon]|nr:hemolysin family protein [Nanoarchaeota archaeon]